MSAEDVIYRRGTGVDALPQGEATTLNDAKLTTDTASPPQELEPLAPAPEAQPEVGLPAPAEPGANVPVWQPDSEDEAWLTGLTLRPDESQTVGAQARTPVPPAVRRALPLLQRAAASPDADPQLMTLVAYLSREAAKG
jgi:hypothetical protein